MYNDHFGFKERPFKLVPDPAFLFLGASHKEALAHLTYAVSQGEGFVVITGEVGTGKTTLCRSFLEGLQPGCNAAYIFNPKLDSVELLKNINAEFALPDEDNRPKELIDTLNTFLLSRKASGQTTILLIDEAHNLSTDVLEQLRLLSNLETTRHKLLQIILVGQPELEQTLASYQMRQLRHRITISCRLQALNRSETRAYILHRLGVAAAGSSTRFSAAAVDCIYRFSRGIPRLINVACDRALLTAFGLDRHRITRAIARAAVKELSSAAVRPARRRFLGPKKMALLVAMILALLWALKPARWMPQPAREPALTAAAPIGSPEPAIADVAVVASPTPAPVPTPTADPELRRLDANVFIKLLQEKDLLASRRDALTSVLARWTSQPLVDPGLDLIESDEQFFRLSAKAAGLKVRRVVAGYDLLAQLDLPAVLAIETQNKGIRYAALHRLGRRQVWIGFDEGRFILDTSAMTASWSGVAYILWRDLNQLVGTIPYDAPAESIITLKILLKKAGFTALALTPDYDRLTVAAVKAIQTRNRIPADGVVGSTTKIVLYNEIEAAGIPRIVTPVTQSGEDGNS